MQNAIDQLRAHALRDLERFYPSNHYWMRPYSLEADYEITAPLIREPESYRLTGREFAAVTAFHNMTFCEMRRRKIYGDAHPVRDIGDSTPSPGVSESNQLEIEARHKIFMESALSYARLIGEQSLIEAFTAHKESHKSEQEKVQPPLLNQGVPDATAPVQPSLSHTDTSMCAEPEREQSFSGHKIKTRTRHLDAEIGEARRRALEPNDFNNVWTELVKMAEAKVGCLLGMAEGEVKFKDGDDVKFFKRKQLRDRMWRDKNR